MLSNRTGHLECGDQLLQFVLVCDCDFIIIPEVSFGYLCCSLKIDHGIYFIFLLDKSLRKQIIGIRKSNELFREDDEHLFIARRRFIIEDGDPLLYL